MKMAKKRIWNGPKGFCPRNNYYKDDVDLGVCPYEQLIEAHFSNS